MQLVILGGILQGTMTQQFVTFNIPSRLFYVFVTIAAHQLRKLAYNAMYYLGHLEHHVGEEHLYLTEYCSLHFQLICIKCSRILLEKSKLESTI